MLRERGSTVDNAEVRKGSTQVMEAEQAGKQAIIMLYLVESLHGDM